MFSITGVVDQTIPYVGRPFDSSGDPIYRTPDMDALDFATLERLADAAEKYHIFSAMEICRLHMKYVRARVFYL